MDLDFIFNANATSLKAVSLFAGAGGCSLGFSKYGINILASYDICQEAVDTYNLNFQGNKCRQRDLSVCDFNQERLALGLERGSLDFIIGGPPCQGFTTAGKRKDGDPRNLLLENYVKALDVFYPRWFMMENVEGILTTTKGDFLLNCVSSMIKLGYTLCIKKVYMQEFGIPQRRKRVIIIGNREGKKFSFPKPIKCATGSIYRNGATTLRSAISDLENNDIEKINHIRKWETGIKMERIRHLQMGQSMKDLPKELQHSSFAKRASRRVCDGTPSEKRGGAPTGLKRLIYDEPSLTITGSASSEFVHPIENRMLTIRECSRIQTFPDDFILVGSDARQAQLRGNAIPPLFANIMAQQIFACDIKSKDVFSQGLQFYDVTKSSAKSPALSSTCMRLDNYLIQPSSF